MWFERHGLQVEGDELAWTECAFRAPRHFRVPLREIAEVRAVETGPVFFGYGLLLVLGADSPLTGNLDPRSIPPDGDRGRWTPGCPDLPAGVAADRLILWPHDRWEWEPERVLAWIGERWGAGPSCTLPACTRERSERGRDGSQ